MRENECFLLSLFPRNQTLLEEPLAGYLIIELVHILGLVSPRHSLLQLSLASGKALGLFVWVLLLLLCLLVFKHLKQAKRGKKNLHQGGR